MPLEVEGMDDLLKTNPHRCYHAKFGRSRSNRVGKVGQNPPKIGELCMALQPWDAVRLTSLRTNPLTVCVATSNFDGCAPKSVGINRGEPQNRGALRPRLLGGKVWLTPRNMPPLPYVLPSSPSCI